MVTTCVRDEASLVTQETNNIQQVQIQTDL